MIATVHDGAGVGLIARRRLRHASIIALAVASLVLTGCSAAAKPAAAKPAGAKPAAEVTYGGLPTFLPTTSVTPDSILIGTVDRPALTTEGDSVNVQLAGASVLMTVTGPEVPGEGLPYQTPSTTCTWTVTMTGATGTVPITIADFSSLDHLGAVYHPVLVHGQPAPPAAISPGQTVTFELRAVMVVGEGLMRWSPGRQQVVASWDFEVEND